MRHAFLSRNVFVRNSPSVACLSRRHARTLPHFFVFKRLLEGRYVDLSVPHVPLATPRGMQTSRRSQMRSPFKQAKSSSTSLEGMERPVRSFKSFIKTVPPNPLVHSKHLPPAPSPAPPPPSPHSATSISSSPHRNSSVISWKAPADWSNGNSYGNKSLETPPILSGREYFPLLPEPSPALSHMSLEVCAAQMVTSPPQQRLLPIYERPTHSDLGPPRIPPRSPLPSPPTAAPRDEKQLPLLPRSSPSGRKAEFNPKYTPLQREFFYRTASPATSVTSDASLPSMKETPFASFGTDFPKDRTPTLEHKSYEPPSSLSPDLTRRDLSYLREQKLRALNKGSPLAEDSWEDAKMDDKTRQLSFSQDYHDLLTDQYEEMIVRPEEVIRHGAPVNGKADHTMSVLKRPRRSNELVPPPLSWKKSTTNSSLRCMSRERTTAEDPTEMSTKQKKRSRTIASWVPQRLSVGSKRQLSKRRNPKSASGPTQEQILESVMDKQTQKDLGFSKFFPPSKPKVGKKWKLNSATKPNDTTIPPDLASTQDYPAPFARFPGDLAVVRTTPSRSSTPPLSSPTKIMPERRHSSWASSIYDSPDHHVSSPILTSYSSDDNRSSYISQTSQTAALVAPTISISKLRSFLPSTHSSTSSHPLAQEMMRPPPPPTSLHDPYTHTRTQSGTSTQGTSSDTGSTWRRFRGANDEEWHKPGLLERAKEARRKHARDTRQEKLRKSIKVLGPTDPGVVQQPYVRSGSISEEWMGIGRGGRKPGYLVST